jgi:glyceraldehyde 3-phosphate dehydrogenase
MVDLTVNLSKEVTVEEVQKAFQRASETTHKGILGVDLEYRVSQDFVGEEQSTVVVMDTIQVIDGNMVKVLSWYDNEWGYSARLVDMAVLVNKGA